VAQTCPSIINPKKLQSTIKDLAKIAGRLAVPPNALYCIPTILYYPGKRCGSVRNAILFAPMRDSL